MNNAQQFAQILEDLSVATKKASDSLRNVDDGYDDDYDGGQEIDWNEKDAAKAEAPAVNKAPEAGPRVASADMVQLPAGDLWKVINSSRKMIRLAREGKIPDQEQRAPLCRAIKAVKNRGLAKRPFDAKLDY